MKKTNKATAPDEPPRKGKTFPVGETRDMFPAEDGFKLIPETRTDHAEATRAAFDRLDAKARQLRISADSRSP